MSGLAALLSGAVNGGFEGADWATNRKRQKKLDEYRAAAEARAAERFGWDRNNQVFTESERARAVADRADYQKAIDDWFASGGDGEGVGVRASTSGQPGPGEMGNTERTPYSSAPPADERPVARPGDIPVPDPGRIAVETLPSATRAAPETADVPAAEEGMTLNEAVASIGPDIVGYGAGHIDPRLADAVGIKGKGAPVEEPSFEDWRKMSRSERQKAGLPVSEAGGLWHYRNRDGGWEGDPGGKISDTVRGVMENLPESSDKNMEAALGARGAVGSAISDVAQGADDMVGDAAALVGRAGNKIVRGAGYAASVVSPKAGAAVLDYADKNDAAYDALAKDGFIPGAARDVDLGGGGAIPAKAAEAATAKTATETLAASDDSGAEVAQATMEALGATKPGAKLSEAQVTRAVKAGSEYYRDNGAREVMHTLMRQGRMDEAMKFEEWLDGKETKAGMESWLRATVAASVGDFDGFSDAIVDAYNRLGYFGDDTTIVKDKSGFTKDEDGNITGAKITFKNETTGETFEQVYDSPNDLVRIGINVLSPKNAFAWHLKSLEQAEQRGAGAAAKAEAATKDRQKRIEDTFKALSENPQFAQLPPEEQMKLVMERVAAVDAAATGATPAQAPPVVYRPSY